MSYKGHKLLRFDAITNHGMWQIAPTGRTSRFPSNKHGHFKLLYARYFNDYSRQKEPLTGAILNSCSKEVCKAKRKAPWNFFCLQNYRSRPTTLTKEKNSMADLSMWNLQIFPEQFFYRTPRWMCFWLVLPLD